MKANTYLSLRGLPFTLRSAKRVSKGAPGYPNGSRLPIVLQETCIRLPFTLRSAKRVSKGEPGHPNGWRLPIVLQETCIRLPFTLRSAKRVSKGEPGHPNGWRLPIVLIKRLLAKTSASLKPVFFTLLTLGCCQFALAETCPSIHDIQNSLIAGWEAHDSDDGKPLNDEQVKTFSKNVAQFALAEWTKNKDNGEIRCYYRDIDGSSLDAYLSKIDYYPNNDMKRWYEVSGHLHCAAGMDKCLFNNPIEDRKRLAERH